jgi:NAD(P)-dependent dehydrogenase (short-subunit alcohol dehydrogenase family)
MALELGPRGIRVNVICPGAVETHTNVSVVEGGEELDRMRKRIALGRVGILEVADVVVFLLGDGSRYVNGSLVEISGGLH